MDTMRSGTLEISSRIASFLPLLWVIAVFVFYLRARMFLGYWPVPTSPDPKVLPFEFHHWALMAAVFPIAWTIFLLPISWLIRFKQIRLLVHREIAPFLVGWAIVAVVMGSSGKNFIAWFLD